MVITFFFVLSLILVIITELQRRAWQNERAQLLDRIMALSNADALLTHKALTDVQEGTVTYMDERREAQLSPIGEYDGSD